MVRRYAIGQRLLAFGRDERGQTLRQYVLAVAVGTLAAVVICTLLAERIYVSFLNMFGP